MNSNYRSTMQHTTFVNYKDSDGNERCQQTSEFNAQTQLSDIVTWILSWLPNGLPFDLQIINNGRMIDFDEKYLNQYRPYDTQSIPSEIELNILPTQRGRYRKSALNNEQQASNANTPVSSQLIQAPTPLTINSNNAVLAFLKNVNNQQRDPENSHSQNIQGDKSDLEDSSTTKAVLPILKVNSTDTVKCDTMNSIVGNILLWEMCKEGTRKLLYHPHHELPSNSSASKIFVVPVTQMMLGAGHVLQLPVKKILGAKTGNRSEKILFCHLENKYSTDSNYETSRLASFLILNGQIIWDTLILSAPMVFTKSNYSIRLKCATDENNEIVEEILFQLLSSTRKTNLNLIGPVFMFIPKVNKSKQAGGVRASTKDNSDTSLASNLPNSMDSIFDGCSQHAANNVLQDSLDNIIVFELTEVDSTQFSSTAAPIHPSPTYSGSHLDATLPIMRMDSSSPTLDVDMSKEDVYAFYFSSESKDNQFMHAWNGPCSSNDYKSTTPPLNLLE